MQKKIIQLRPYQKEALASIPDAGAFLICLATGLGKTICMSQIPRRGRMLILSHRDELVHQPEKYFDCSFGVEQGSETSHGEEVISASVQSLVRRLDKFRPNDFDVMVTDECFPAGTKVDGIPIEDIKVGDYVTAFNHATNLPEKRRVLHTFKRKSPPFLVCIGGHFACTSNHPIYDLEERKYIQAEKIKLGSGLIYYGGGFGNIGAVTAGVSKKVPSSSPYVYNLEVEELNNYFANGILVHNCHHSTAKTYRTIYEYFTPRLHIGFTATPNRNDGTGLKAIYKDIIYARDLRWGIENGYLCNIQCLRVDIGVDLRHVAQRLGDYAPDALSKAVNIENANDAIAEAYKLYAKPPVLVFCASVAHAEALAAKIPGAVAVRGGEDRSEIVQAFSEGKIPCITNCMVFTEGTDLPNVQTVIIARPTKNVSLYTQMTGRGTRLHEGKEFLTLIDCVGAGDNVDICTAPSLLGLDIDNVQPEQRESLQGNLFDLPDIIAGFEDTPEAWIKNVKLINLWARRNNYDLHGVNFFKMPDGSFILNTPRIIIPAEDHLGRVIWKGKIEPTQKVFDEVFHNLAHDYSDIRALWDLNIMKRWGDDPATEKQKAYIKRYFPNLDTRDMTKFDAGQIITRHRATPLTPKQKYVLERRGYDTKGMTKWDGIREIGRLRGA